MTIKEKLESIKGKKIAIWCFDEWQARIIHKYLDSDEFDYINNCYWDSYGGHTCYDYQDMLMYAGKDWFEKNEYDVISFGDFMNEFDLSHSLDIELTQQDINAILDEKYGKYNWVVK